MKEIVLQKRRVTIRHKTKPVNKKPDTSKKVEMPKDYDWKKVLDKARGNVDYGN